MSSTEISIQARGRYNYGFTILSDMVRDEWGPLVGGEAAYVGYMIISWAGNGDRGARMSSRYLKSKTRFSSLLVDKCKALLLEHLPHIFACVPGNATTPETWWVDFDALLREHTHYLTREQAKRDAKRGPGRPKKPAPESGAPLENLPRNPEHHLQGFKTDFGKNLFRNPEHPRSGFRSTPVPESGAHTHIPNDIAEDILKTTPSAPAPGGVDAQPAQGSNSETGNVPSVTQVEQQAPDGAGADAPTGQASPVQVAKVKASGKTGKAASKKNVPPAGAAADGPESDPTPHVLMMNAIRATLYPRVTSCVEPVEKQIAQASKQFRSAGFEPEDISEIYQFVKRVEPWRHSITPSTLVTASAKWASQRALQAPGQPPIPTATQPAVKKGFLR
ncbi:hypothetical protein ACMT4L_16935 [Deinococcus sp. A31D244]|uniref:hypothetical protein n=1 Tax=Deinococcus sp. A31D244 TaxID=3397675 RepID=UPI0039DFAC21